MATRVGYTGGLTQNPTYKSVCWGDGHTEAIKITFDPDVIPYSRLLSIFWKEHSPTYRAKAQYKSAVYYHTEEQRQQAEVMKADVTRQRGTCLTDIEPAKEWYDAEEYHQKYVEKHRRY